MKNKTFIKSIVCALRGLSFALRSEKNFKYYLLIDLIFLIVDLYLRVSPAIWLGYIISSCSVYAMECVNTSIEHLCDFIYKDYSGEIKIIKDVAAAGVLFCGIGFFSVQIVAIVLYFLS